MAEKVFMNVPAVRQIAKNFKQVGDTLENVARAMEVLVNILRAPCSLEWWAAWRWPSTSTASSRTSSRCRWEC